MNETTTTVNTTNNNINTNTNTNTNNGNNNNYVNTTNNNKLNLRFNGLSVLDPSICTLSYLTSLDLSNNKVFIFIE